MGRRAKRKQAALQQRMFAATESQLERYNQEQTEQRKLLEAQKGRYRQFDFKNPYAGVQNAFQNFKRDFDF